MGDQPQQDEEEASTPATMRQSKIVKEIMGKVVAKKSSINYAPQNSTFALFVYEKNEELRGHLLESWFVERLAAFATLTEKKKYVQECLLACSPEDNNCPFILSNLTFAHFSNFLSTRTRSRGKNKGRPNSLGVSSYDMAKSALVHLYWMSKYDIPVEFAIGGDIWGPLQPEHRGETFRQFADNDTANPVA